MCIISKPIQDVADTKILVAVDTTKTRQLIVYSNTVINLCEKNAMILPVLNPNTILFHDLTNYSNIFIDCNNMIINNNNSVTRSINDSKQTVINSRNTLKVISVGSYQVSVAPTFADLKKVDSTVFELSSGCEKLLKKEYCNSNFGFIICKLNDNEKKTYHPFGYSHNIYNNRLFIPTKHYHSHSHSQSHIFTFNNKNDELWSHSIYLYNANGLLNSNINSTGFWTKKNNIKLNKIDFSFGKLKFFQKYYISGKHPNIDLYSSLLDTDFTMENNDIIKQFIDMSNYTTPQKLVQIKDLTSILGFVPYLGQN